MGIAEALSLKGRVNLLGVLGAALLFYVALSGGPWWIVVGGAAGFPAFSVALSPFTCSIDVLGRPLTIPIVPYLLLAAKLSVLLAAASTLAGSLLLSRSWSRPLMSTKGFTVPFLFVLMLFLGLQAAQAFGLALPLHGSSTLSYPFFFGGFNVALAVPVHAELTGEYWLALAAGAVTLAAKLVHGRLRGAAGSRP
ncbi:MAG: hypothetical protein QFX33_03990 [Candidatus Nezhaarchaeota archaeon]|nr:hypothetical protein [Candidatus Nezhaarchaeota archaeon]